MVATSAYVLAALGVPTSQSEPATRSMSASLYGAQQQWPAVQAIRFGNAVAALVVTGERGVLDAPMLEQVETFLGENS
ncbi:MAG: hypothetical protein OER90_11785 [Gemmatimonadota bacterium]|nr:hypothetical protein [Gemmatimonadota bacterium]